MPMNQIDEILEYMAYIRQQSRPVSIVNSYQGVSLSLEVDIRQISRTDENIVVAAHFNRPLSLLPATMIQIHSDLFPKPIQAMVASVDIHHRTAVLRNLTFIQNKKENRKETRVQPGHEINARLTIGGKNEIRGVINDLSIEGISLIVVSNNEDLLQNCPPDTSVRVLYDLLLSTHNEPVALSMLAKVTYINAINPLEKYRVGFRTYPKEDQKNILRRYIFDRQTEIFNELGQESLPRQSPSVIF